MTENLKSPKEGRPTLILPVRNSCGNRGGSADAVQAINAGFSGSGSRFGTGDVRGGGICRPGRGGGVPAGTVVRAVVSSGGGRVVAFSAANPVLPEDGVGAGLCVTVGAACRRAKAVTYGNMAGSPGDLGMK